MGSIHMKIVRTAAARLALWGLALVCGLAAVPASADMRIVILRHGEKPADGLGQLTCQGLNRSLALAPLLLSRFGVPDAVYAPNPGVLKKDKGVPFNYVRPLATIEPLAIRAGKPVTLGGGMEDITPLVHQVLAKEAGTHVIAWEHHWGESLARLFLKTLGADPTAVPQWADDDYDSLYVIRVQQAGHAAPVARFSVEKQGLDGLPDACPVLVPTPAAVPAGE